MKYLTNSGLSYFLNKIKAYLTSSTYLNSIGISNSEIDDIADDAGYSSGSLPASEDIFITGDIIPNTDNSVDLGASSKNIKMIYTKGITINGTQFLPSNFVNVSGAQTIGGIKTFSNAPVVGSIDLDGKIIDTDANGNMTYDSHIVDTIEEQGNGYIRYSNGLQICWTDNELVTQSSSGTWTYPRTFISLPLIFWQADGNNTVYVDAVNGGARSSSNAVFIPTRYMNGSIVAAPYGVTGLAIGRWK